MKPPVPAFETTYGHDRRVHRHRCACCRRIVNTGEQVVMAKVSKGSRVVHLSCADRESINGWTFRDSLTAWGTEYLRACGYRLPPHPMSFSASVAPPAQNASASKAEIAPSKAEG